jgi:hypothetical protein
MYIATTTCQLTGLAFVCSKLKLSEDENGSYFANIAETCTYIFSGTKVQQDKKHLSTENN